MNTRSRTRCLLASTLASTLLLQAAVSYADDTEIFFGGTAIDAGIQPNVLFVMDNSGSMSGTRMTQLKEAFNTIITSAGNINVGVMSMNTNPRLLSPVQDINKSMNVKLSTPEVIVSGDDAIYNSATAATTIADPTLVMGYVNSGSSPGSVTRNLGTDNAATFYTENASYYVVTKSSVDYACSAKIITAGTTCTGAAKTQINSTKDSGGNDGLMLFRNLNIPAGATITSAKLILTPTSVTANSGKQPALSVKLENTKTAAAFNSDTSMAGRTFSVSNLQTTVAAANLTGNEVVLNIATQLTNLKALAPTTNPVADIAIRVRGTTSTSYSYYIGDGSATAPRLEVTWTGSESSTRTTGIRFQNVAIPKGATITSARIDFVPAASDDRAVTYSVTAQNADDAAVFATTENFTNRTKTTTSSTWTPFAWKTAAPQVYVEGPIVTAQVQSAIDSAAGWCGNNNMAFFITPTAGTGSRTAFAVDAGNNLQPVLNVSYTGGDTGCLNPVVNISVYDTKDDAYQTAKDQAAVLTGSTIAFTNAYIGSRYVKVPVKKNATVMEASIIATPNNTTAGSATVFFENADNSAAFAATNNNIYDRDLTATGASCSFTPVAAGTPITCTNDGLKTQLQSIFNRANWADGNSLSVIMKPASTAFAMRTRENSATAALRLRIKLASGGLGSNSYTVRDYTNGIVQALVASGGTPIVPTLYDAAGYLTQTTGKHVGSTASPINSSCQANYLVFLTDGEANGTTTAAKDGIATLTGQTCSADKYADEVCARTLVEWMATHDMAEYDGLNTVKTSTIGFNTSGNAQATTLLRELAAKGGGTAYKAENAADLANAFDDIVQSALATNTTFVSASAPVNAFKSSENLDERYYALFRPSESNRWTGNVKRYKSMVVNGVTKIVDADDTVAIDKNTGFFGANTRSFWSTSQDGNDVAKGGAAAQLPAPGDRHLYTYTGTAPSGSATALEALSSSNAGITKTKLGDASMDDTVRSALLSYIRGGPDATGTGSRSALGDPIHASPELVTYACTKYVAGQCTVPDISLLIGTNEGFIQSFDTDTGAEEWGFMPQELLPNIKTLRDNVKSSSQKPRLYGMDNTVSVWVNDVDKNGVIYGKPSDPTDTTLNPGEFVYAYATMGRGGRNIYALDITNRSNPKILWQILGGTTAGFEQLSQTWSTPVKTKIQVGSNITDVLVFAGGYDPAQDALNLSTSINKADTLGNALYIVNAKTGALIWSASANTAYTHTMTLAKMKYSMPAPVKVIDIQKSSSGVLVADPNKLADQIFATDTGGQVWRFYINNGSPKSSLVTPGGTGSDGVFASIAGTTPGTARKFYTEPDVAILNVNSTKTLTVNVGSGYRGHPLNEYITDRFYSFRTANVFKSTNDGTLTESNMYDATQNLIQSGSDEQKETAKNALSSTSGGWYITLTNAGEKVLSPAVTQAGDLFFNTYEPSTASAACSASVGVNRAYAVILADGTPKVVPEGSNGTAADRSRTSTSGGIAGKPLITCSAGDKCEESSDLPLDNYPLAIPPQGKTYWIDQSNLD